MHTKRVSCGKQCHTQVDATITDFIQSYTSAQDAIDVRQGCLHVLSGHFKTKTLSIHCLSVLMRMIWIKFRIRTTGIIDGQAYQLDDNGSIYESD